MNSLSSDILQVTMSGLDAGLHVLHITTPNPQTCAVSNTVEVVRANERFRGFDHIPVVNDTGRMVGVLALDGNTRGPVRDAMRPLDDTMIVSSDQPLMQFLPTLAEHPYRLVVRGTRIGGIVTRSDVLKLPVRLLSFTLVTHLEMIMANLIRAKHPNDDEWVILLSTGRREGVDKKFAAVQESKLDPSRLEFTDFCDKRDLVVKLYEMDAQFKRDLKDIENLRNAVAHAGSYGRSQEELMDFLRVLQRSEYWISELTEKLETSIRGDIA